MKPTEVRAMWDGMPQDAPADQVFQALQDKGETFARPWSVAELHMGEEDVRWLQEWFSDIEARVGAAPWGKKRTMLGGILVVLGAEMCRRESHEDSVWPTIGRLVPCSSRLWQWMFYPANGQPTLEMTAAIADGVSTLNLRNVIDLEGVQQWFGTIKLQFGFTRSGAKNRLAEWLAGYPRPHSVGYLLGELGGPDLASKSFQSLWQALSQYRRGDIDADQTTLVLNNSPWTLREWIPLLLKAAREKIYLGNGDRDYTPRGDDAPGEAFNPITRILLDWKPGKAPRLRFELDREGLLQEVETSQTNELRFHVDARSICQWLLQSDGSWSGNLWLAAEQDTQGKQPNLKPHTLTISSGSDDYLFSWDFTDSGLAEDVLVFDLDNAGLLQPRTRRLEPKRNYAIICDKGCIISGCDPLERFQTGSRVVFRLPAPLNENIALQFQDFVLWQPVRPLGDPEPTYSVVLQTPPGHVYPLDGHSELFINGLPNDVTDVRLLIGQKVHNTIKSGDVWRTDKAIPLTPELAAHQVRIYARFCLDSKSRTIRPSISLAVKGLALAQEDAQLPEGRFVLRSVRSGTVLNRSEESHSLRVYLQGAPNTHELLESKERVAHVTHERVRLRHLTGLGGNLTGQDSEGEHDFNVRCCDCGPVRTFVHPMMGKPAQLCFLKEIDPKEPGREVILWIRETPKRTIHKSISILPTSTKRIWRFDSQSSDAPLAVALAFKGDLTGAWWDLERIEDYFSQASGPNPSDFAYLRWFRVPILDETRLRTTRERCVQFPVRVLGAWRNNAGLPNGLTFSSAEDTSLVPRKLLWNHRFAIPSCSECLDAVSHCTRGDAPEKCVNHFGAFLHLSLGLFNQLLLKCRRQCPNKCAAIRDLFLQHQLNLDPGMTENLLRKRLRECKERSSCAAGAAQDDVDMAFEMWINGANPDPASQTVSTLQSLGRTLQGRKYLACSLVRHVLA